MRSCFLSGVSGGNLNPKCAHYLAIIFAYISRTLLSMLRIEGFDSIYTAKKENASFRMRFLFLG